MNNAPKSDVALTILRDGLPGIRYEGGELTSGMPLGAVGTGYTVLNGDGRLGESTIFNDFPAAYTLRQPPDLNCELLAMQREGGPVEVMALPLLGRDGRTVHFAERLEYSAHFPRAMLALSFEGGAGVEIDAWSPFIPGNPSDSNIPSFILDIGFDFSHNVGSVPSFVDVILRVPLSSEIEGFDSSTDFARMRSFWTALKFGRQCGQSLAVCGDYGTSFESFQSGRIVSERGDLLTWIGETDTGDAAIALRLGLDQNGQGSLSLVHSWYYPSFEVGGAFPYEHMYGERYGSVAEVIDDTVTRLSELRVKSTGWQEALFHNNQPGWLGDSLVNSLYCIAKNSWWNVDQSPDSRMGEFGVFTMNETFRDCPVTNTIPCHYFAHLPILWLFPELERTTIEYFEGFQLQSGEIPFALAYGSGLYDPRYHCVHTANSAMFVEIVARYFRRTGDIEWLKGRMPSLQKAIQFTLSLDFDGDCLIEERPHALPGRLWPANNYHDAFPWHGVAAHTNGIWMGALASLAELSRVVGDAEGAANADRLFETARSNFNRVLWNGEFFRMYADGRTALGEASLTNQLCGEWSQAISHRRPVLADDRIQSALTAVLRLNVGHDRLPPEAVAPDGIPVRVGGALGGVTLAQEQGLNCMVSEAVCLAATLVSFGHREAGLDLAKALWEVHAITWATPFNQYYMVATDNGRPVWGNDYLSNLVVWSLLAVLDETRQAIPPIIQSALEAESSLAAHSEGG